MHAISIKLSSAQDVRFVEISHEGQVPNIGSLLVTFYDSVPSLYLSIIVINIRFKDIEYKRNHKHRLNPRDVTTIHG